MDYLFRHVAGGKRLLNATAPLASMGFLPRKKDEIRRIFPTVNFSFILSGTGYYWFQGKRHVVEVPTVLTQWPGEPMHYGPDRTWEELFLIFSEDTWERLRESGFFRDGRSLWTMGNPAGVRVLAEELYGHARNWKPGDCCDKIDLLAHMMVTESLLERPRRSQAPYYSELHAIERRLREKPEAFYDFDEIAAGLNISVSTFRRYFLTYFKMPPGDYLIDCRIANARRLLVESALPVAEVAHLSGFADSGYFSRLFHQRNGLSPKAYRAENRCREFLPGNE